MFFGMQRGDGDGAWTVLIGMVAMIAGLIVLAVANLRFPDVPLLVTLGLQDASSVSTTAGNAATYSGSVIRHRGTCAPSLGLKCWLHAARKQGSPMRFDT